MTRSQSRDDGILPDGADARLEAFREESDAFVRALVGLPTSAWDRRTRCDPWQVRDVVGHVITVLARVPDMVLSEFLTTRIVESAVHGLDVADAAGREPWLTTAAAEHLQQLLFGPDWHTSVAALGWDPVTVLRKTTGRGSVTAQEDAELKRLGLRSLTLG